MRIVQTGPLAGGEQESNIYYCYVWLFFPNLTHITVNHFKFGEFSNIIGE